MPDAALARIDGLDQGRSYVIVLGAACAPCRELAADLHGTSIDARLVAVLSAANRDFTDDGVTALFPPWVEVLRDPGATEVVRALDVETTPFAFEITDGRVSAKAILHGAHHLAAFTRGDVEPNGAPRMSTAMEVIQR